MKKEFIDPTEKRIRQTYGEYIRYYYWPPTHFSDANPASLFAGRNTPAGNENLGYLTTNSKMQRSQFMESSTELHYPFSLILAAFSLYIRINFIFTIKVFIWGFSSMQKVYEIHMYKKKISLQSKKNTLWW